MKLSIVSTLYQSAPSILEFCSRASEVARQIASEDFEIILVNDGSIDNSLELAISLTEENAHLIVVDLSRNFGHHKAMMTGLRYSRGEYVFLIDSDLEERPEWLLQFYEHFSEYSCDVIYGVQANRRGNWWERVSGHWFYTFFNWITKLEIPNNIVTARLMSRRYVDALSLHEEREVFMAGLWYISGFKQIPILINKKNTSETTYTFRKKLSMFINAVTSFSNAPLVHIFYIGFCISIFAVGYILYLVAHWMIIEKPLSGWTSVMASIWLLGGMIISFIGVVGIYLSKVFSETKRRPYTIVRHIYAKSKR